MKTAMKVLLYLKKNEQDENGFCPLMGKITIQGKQNSTAQFSCKIKINAQIWNSTSQRCTGKSREAIAKNKEIETLLLRIRSRFKELDEKNETVSADELKNTFQGIASMQATLLTSFQEHNDEYALRVGVNRAASTYAQYKNTKKILSNFIRFKYKVSDVAIKSMDIMFIEAFDMYMKIELKFKPQTRLGHINRLKSITHIAIHKGIITVYPFAGFKPERAERKQLYLTEEDLSKIMNTTFDTPNRNFTRDMFLFSAFTGIGYCDMKNLTEKNLTKDKDGRLWISTNRQKTQTPENVLLLHVAIELIEKYKDMAEDGKLFPMLTKESMNRHLKKIAKECEINRNISFHHARHTFASQICLSQGVPIETVSQAMGHKNISTTQRYAKVTHEKIDRDISKIYDTIENKYSLQGIDSPPSTILKDMSRRKVRPSRKLLNREEK